MRLAKSEFFRLVWLSAFLGAIVLGLLIGPASAQVATGTLDGVVLDAGSGEPLPGAKISVDGTVLTAATDRDGRFRLVAPAGTQALVVTYLGWQEQRVDVTVTAGRAEQIEVRLLGENNTVRETVTVRGEWIRDAQARALNQQHTAPNITNVVSADQIGQFPDTNAVEAVQRIPGISIQRDQGEGRYIIVRGTEPRLNSLMINGERVPSPDAELRQVAADVIPADLLETIEVSKALTPDMDADAIGGAVNLVTKEAPNEPVFLFTAAGGYNALNEDFAQGQGGFTWGQRLLDRKVGLMISASALNTNRGSDNFEVEYDDGDLDTLEIRDYRINRKRSGLNFAVDYRASNDSSYFVRGVYNYFSDQEFRRQLINVVSDNELERDLKDRFESESIAQFTAGGEHLVPSGWLLDYHFTASYAENDRPDEVISVFKQEEDREGIGIYTRPDGTGYIICTDQIAGSTRYLVYRREGEPGQPHDHSRLLAVLRSEADSTDGIEVSSRPLGPTLPEGALVAMNSGPQNFLVFNWRNVMAAAPALRGTH